MLSNRRHNTGLRGIPYKCLVQHKNHMMLFLNPLITSCLCMHSVPFKTIPVPYLLFSVSVFSTDIYMHVFLSNLLQSIIENKGLVKKGEGKQKIPVKAVIVNKSKQTKTKKHKKENLDDEVIQLSQGSVVSSSQERYEYMKYR